MAAPPNDQDESSMLLQAIESLPLFDDLFLRMQAQNIAMVNAHIIDIEHDMFSKYMEMESTPIPEALFTSAISQMWIFSLYELLRTWRHRIQEIITHRQLCLAGKKPAVVAPEGIDIDINRPYLNSLLRAETDEDFVKSLQDAYDRVEPVFRDIEGVRITLAKHEIPKAKGSKAANVGYARIDPLSGSMNFFYLDKDGYSNMVSRHSIVEQLLKILRADT